MATPQIPSPGRVVHFVIRDELGRIVHRNAHASSVITELNGDYVINLHACLEPGDNIPGSNEAKVSNLTPGQPSQMPLLFFPNVVPSQPIEGEAFEPLLGTWHWPERK